MRRVTFFNNPTNLRNNFRSFSQEARLSRKKESLSEQIARLKQQPALAETYRQMQIKAVHMEKKIDEQPQRYDRIENFITPTQPEIVEIASDELEEALAKAEKNHKLSIYG